MVDPARKLNYRGRMTRTALSLFTSGGLGDLAVRQAGFDILVSNEVLEDRHALFKFNFPSTFAITGDIWRQGGPD